MPFGFTNCPSYFQEVMLMALGDYVGLFVIVYIDDILIHSKNETDHRIHVMLVLIRLRKAGLKIKIEKCDFCRDSVTNLGFKVSREGISVSDEKCRAIKESQTPKTTKQLWNFII